jgi:hypothetical protein
MPVIRGYERARWCPGSGYSVPAAVGLLPEATSKSVYVYVLCRGCQPCVGHARTHRYRHAVAGVVSSCPYLARKDLWEQVPLAPLRVAPDKLRSSFPISAIESSG